MGFGFRCGFLGLLHMEIVQERLEREYGLDLVTSAPTVVYEIVTTDGEVHNVDNPSKLPPLDRIEEMREPIITANILVPPEHVGAVLQPFGRTTGATVTEAQGAAGIPAVVPGIPGRSRRDPGYAGEPCRSFARLRRPRAASDGA